MAHTINITDKLEDSKPVIQIGDKHYEVNNSMGTLFKFQELAASATANTLIDAVTLAIGEKAAKEMDLMSLSMPAIKVLMTAITAAMQGLTYEEADARFRRAE